MEWKYCVIEIQQQKTSLIYPGGLVADDAVYKNSKSVWNILFTAPYDPNANDEVVAFDACMVWLEQNKVYGSKYVITEMFFV